MRQDIVRRCNDSSTAFWDGSIHAITYSIDPRVHGYLCGRQDGQVIDGSMN